MHRHRIPTSITPVLLADCPLADDTPDAWHPDLPIWCEGIGVHYAWDATMVCLFDRNWEYLLLATYVPFQINEREPVVLVEEGVFDSEGSVLD